MPSVVIPGKASRSDLRLRAEGLLAEPWPRSQISAFTALTLQTVYFQLVGLQAGDVVTGVAYHLNTNGASITLGKVALYDTSGNRLAVSANSTASFTSGASTNVALPFTATYTVTANAGYYVAVLNVGGTGATLGRDGAPTGGSDAIGTGARPMAVMTGQTDMPSTATFAAATLSPWLAAY